MSNLQGDDYSPFWANCIIIHASITFIYVCIFWMVYYFNYRHKIIPKDRLLISTNIISTIHCFVVVFGAVTAFFYDELYLIENMMVSKNGLLAYVWVCWNSYMLADLISLFILYIFYDSTTIKPRYDIIIHHIISYAVFPLFEIPTPIYGWFIMIWPPITEVSSIFLNLQWFGSYHKWSSWTQKRIKICFYITWFTVRLPSLWCIIITIILFWDDIIDLWPVRPWITGLIVTVSINLLHIIWTIVIVKGIWVLLKQNQRRKYVKMKLLYHTPSHLKCTV
eukprot:503378_1